MKSYADLNKLFAVALLSGVIVACGSDSDGKKKGGASCESGTRELGANETEGVIPDKVFGTYELTFHAAASKSFEAPAESPYTDGDSVEFEIKEDGSLVIDGEIALCDPIHYRDNTFNVVWFDDENELSYEASWSDKDEFNELNVANNFFYDEEGFVFIGQFNDRTE